MDFDEIVKKIAHSPRSAAVLRQVPYFLKEGAPRINPPPPLTVRMFGPGGGQKILAGTTEKLLTGALLAGGVMAAQSLRNSMKLESEDQAKARMSETGKLQAQNQFKLQSAVFLKPQHERVFKEVMKDDVIAKADKDLMKSVFETMKRFAPNLSADPNAVKSYLREHAVYGTGPSYASLKNLAEAEQAISRAGGAGHVG